MSLDKILGTKKPAPKKTTHKPKSSELINDNNNGKFTLVCKKPGCKNSRILRKKALLESDKICPKCKSVMVIKNKKDKNNAESDEEG